MKENNSKKAQATGNKKATSSNACKGCRGGFRCYNSNSPCFLYYCGEYPGTGPEPS